MTPDIQAAREAAERLRRIHKGECYLSVYGGGTGWIQNDPSDPYNVDMRIGFGLLLAALADPTVLLPAAKWEDGHGGFKFWNSGLGRYECLPNSDGTWNAGVNDVRIFREQISLAAAQSACEADFRERMRGAFGVKSQTTPNP